MRITEIKLINDHREAYEIIKRGKIKFDCEIAILHQNNGFVWTNPIVVQGSKNDDIISLLDEIYSNTNSENLPFRLWTMEEIEETYGEIDEYFIDYLNDFIPINGGEYYTDLIEFVEEI